MQGSTILAFSVKACVRKVDAKQDYAAWSDPELTNAQPGLGPLMLCLAQPPVLCPAQPADASLAQSASALPRPACQCSARQRSALPGQSMLPPARPTMRWSAYQCSAPAIHHAMAGAILPLSFSFENSNNKCKLCIAGPPGSVAE
jgi:hypothetical protein